MSQTEAIELLTLLDIRPGHLTSIPHAAGDGDRKLTAEEEEAQRIAEMGKPVLGENCRLEVIIEESYDFKVTFLGLPFPETCPELCWVGRWGDEVQESNANLKVGDHNGSLGSLQDQLQHCGMHMITFLDRACRDSLNVGLISSPKAPNHITLGCWGRN